MKYNKKHKCLADSPCKLCPKNDICPKGCDTWRVWFKGVWNETRKLFAVN